MSPVPLVVAAGFPALPVLMPEAELTPLVVLRVEMVLAALEPTGSETAAAALLANGSSELWISAMAFWW